MKLNYEYILGLSIIFVLIAGTVTILFTQQIVNEYSYKREIRSDPKKIFDLLSDIKNYHTIFPFVDSVKILNQTKNTIYAEETISYHGFTRSVKVKHELEPYEKHTITILSDELKNTTFTIKFIEQNSNSIVKINGKLYFPAYLGYSINTNPQGINDFQKFVNTNFMKYILIKSK